MAKILKNTTLSDIEIDALGFTVPASGQITIPTQKYLILASDDAVTELSTLINSGDIVVNDGNQDLFAERGIAWIKYQDNVTPSNTVYIATSGSNTTGDGTFTNPYADLTGVYNALVSGDYTANSSSPLIIECASGNYTQDSVDFSSYSNILIRGAGPRTRFSASNANADLITLGPSMSARSIGLQGVTNSSNWHLVYSTTGSGVGSLTDIFITAGSNGIKLQNTTGTFRVSAFNTLSSSLDGTVFEANSNTVFTINSVSVLGDGTNTIGIVQNGSSQIFSLGGRYTNMNKILQINGDTGSVQLIGVTGANALIALDQQGNSFLEILGGNFDSTTSNITDTSLIEGYFFNELPIENQFRVLSEFSVGLPNRGRETSLGKGDSYVTGMKVYTYNGTTYTDVSEDAASGSGSTFTFPNLSVNSAIYISTAFDITNPLKFYGFKTDVTTTAMIPGMGDIVFEYYNGTSWVEFNHMVVEAQSPFKQSANDKFTSVSGTGKFHINFDKTIESNWAVNDPVSLGVNLYWIRMRIEGMALTTAPVFEQFKIHTDRLEIEANGFQNMFGTGRIQEKFPITFTGLDTVVGKAPNDQAVYISDNIGIDFANNSFPPNQNRAIIFTQFIPFELDTSCPLEASFSFFGNSSLAGDAAFRIRWATTKDGDSIYTSTATAPTAAPNERNTSGVFSFGIGENNTKQIFTVNLEIPEAIPQQITGEPNSKVWIEIERNTADVSDTYAGDIILTDFALFYTACREGGYSGDFS